MARGSRGTRAAALRSHIGTVDVDGHRESVLGLSKRHSPLTQVSTHRTPDDGSAKAKHAKRRKGFLQGIADLGMHRERAEH